eukprot:715077_1
MHSIIGYKCVQIMNCPMFLSTSPSDFWTKRWNMLIHNLLKRGIYKPIRRHCSIFLATAAVFIFSGVMHEWVVHICFVYHRTNIPQDAFFKPSNIVFGANMAFFVYGFVPIALEKA